MRIAVALAALLALAASAAPAAAQQEAAPERSVEAAAPPAPAEPPPPAYDDRLVRLSEILGSLHFLRGLCRADDADAWRQEMEALLQAEAPAPARRARIVASFNHGFETFHAVYRVCTPSAERAVALYLAEGARLSAEIRSRYSQ